MINIVLFEPEIPQNTGNIMRTCVATNSKLHLIKPLGFSLEDKYLKRSGLDYLEYLDYQVYENYNDFVSKNKGTYYFLTRYGKKPHTSFDYSNEKEDIYLIFGKESTGIEKSILIDNLDNCMRIPINDKVRSLNLSNCVAIMLYEVLRQQSFINLSKVETFKGEDYLLELKKGSN
ncbi:MAG: tRNA (cytidine(34)-2'-O)-methyltransferase [Bacilli bacterium]|nr:tRNA (cytidine(34)-2'-O)-methyltransferase [Bacilli bacterium]